MHFWQAPTHISKWKEEEVSLCCRAVGTSAMLHASSPSLPGYLQRFRSAAPAMCDTARAGIHAVLGCRHLWRVCDWREEDWRDTGACKHSHPREA